MSTDTSSTLANNRLVSQSNKRRTDKGLLAFRDEILLKLANKTTYKSLEDFYHVNRFYLWNIVKNENYTPPTKVMKTLGIDVIATVIVIGGGDIPEGAQVVSAELCECGQPFISNHPMRKRCFICSPYRGKRKERKL